jgi:hypothetical protein
MVNLIKLLLYDDDDVFRRSSCLQPLLNKKKALWETCQIVDWKEELSNRKREGTMTSIE